MQRGHVFILMVLVTAVSAVVPPVVGAAVQLPAQLVERLRADRRAAERALDQQRGELASVALAQREAAADAALVDEHGMVLEQAAQLVGTTLPHALQQVVDDARSDTRSELDEADTSLEKVTQRTADAQGRALDADRRLRALQRAGATEHQDDAESGSWHFGSGGPAVSARSLDAYLQSKGSPLAGQGAALLRAGVRERIDPRLVVAIAGAESYFGITPCASHNAWGWGCPTSPASFASWSDAIDAVMHGLRERYVDDGLDTVGEIHLRYAPPAAANDPDGLNYAWAENVARFLVEQGGDPQAVSGVVGNSR